MAKDANELVVRKLDVVIGLLQHLLALELSKNGATQEQIRKHLHVAQSTVVKMLQGIKKEK